MKKDYIERDIIVGAILSDRFLTNLKQIYKSEYIQSKTAKKLINWCLKYYESYKEAPKKLIRQLYEKNQAKMSDDEIEWIDSILTFLSEEYEDGRLKFNAEYLLDETEKYFMERSAKILAEQIESDLADGNIDSAIESIQNYKTIIKPSIIGVDPFNNDDLVRQAFDFSTEQLLNFPGILGKTINDQCIRDAFIAIMAPEKRGKSFWLMEFKFRALKDLCKIAFFQAGDMSELQQIRREYVWLASKSYKQKYCGEYLLPIVDCFKNQTGGCDQSENDSPPFLGFDEKQLRELSAQSIFDTFNKSNGYKICRKCYRDDILKFRGAIWFKRKPAVTPLTVNEALRAKEEYFHSINMQETRCKLATYPNDSLSVGEIERQLQLWEDASGFIPDIIIIDYADLLIPDKSIKDDRHKHDHVWKRLRALSQKRHCLVITATQADAASYKKDSLGLENFSEDKRKYAHVTAMYGINQTKEEKLLGIMRISELLLRDDDFAIDKQVKVLCRLQMGRPFLASFY